MEPRNRDYYFECFYNQQREEGKSDNNRGANEGQSQHRMLSPRVHQLILTAIYIFQLCRIVVCIDAFVCLRR